jgi:hypothetical protein
MEMCKDTKDIVTYIHSQKRKYLEERVVSRSDEWKHQLNSHIFIWCEDIIRDSFQYKTADQYRESSFVIFRRLNRYCGVSIIKDTLKTVQTYLLSRSRE